MTAGRCYCASRVCGGVVLPLTDTVMVSLAASGDDCARRQQENGFVLVDARMQRMGGCLCGKGVGRRGGVSGGGTCVASEQAIVTYNEGNEGRQCIRGKASRRKARYLRPARNSTVTPREEGRGACWTRISLARVVSWRRSSAGSDRQPPQGLVLPVDIVAVTSGPFLAFAPQQHSTRHPSARSCRIDSVHAARRVSRPE